MVEIIILLFVAAIMIFVTYGAYQTTLELFYDKFPPKEFAIIAILTALLDIIVLFGDILIIYAIYQ